MAGRAGCLPLSLLWACGGISSRNKAPTQHREETTDLFWAFAFLCSQGSDVYLFEHLLA